MTIGMAGEENVKGDIPGFQVLVARDGAPHFQRVGVHGVFRAGLLVFAVERVEQPVGPAVPVEPVEGPPDGEVLVPRAGVGNVPDEHVDVGLVGGHPRRVEVPDDGGRVDEVAPVEVVVVVQRVAKVDAVVARHVCGGRDHAAPGACLCQTGYLVIIEVGMHSLSYTSGNCCVFCEKREKATFSCASPAWASP